MKLASEAPFPYGWPGMICYFTTGTGDLWQIRTRTDMRTAVREALARRLDIFAVWPGQHRSDLFLIDKPELLAEAIGETVEPPPPEYDPGEDELRHRRKRFEQEIYP